mgnify:CR=1 FL=1
MGRARPVAVHELLGMAGQATRPDALAIERFTRALADYNARRFREAAAGFTQVRALCGGTDGPSELYLGLIAGFEVEPPPGEWDGVIRLTTK